MSQPQNLRADDLPLTSRTTNLTSAPESTEALMAVTDPTSPADSVTLTAVPAPAPDVLASVTRPRLWSVGGSHTVPATARYAAELTDGALALRLQAITRLGVESAPHRLSSIAAYTTHQPQARKLALVPDGAEQAAGQPDGAQPPHASRTDAPSGLSAVPDAGAARVDAETGAHAEERADALAGDQHAPGAGAVRGGRVRHVAQRVATAQPSKASQQTQGEQTYVGQARGRCGELPVVPEARVWGGRLAQAVSEVLAGDRPISQLVRFTDDVVFMELNRRVRLLGLNTTAGTRGAKEKSAVQSVRVFMPKPFIAEVAAHVRRGGRSRAIALRMEIRRNRWVCTALEIG
ncbi:Rv3235 family protein [Kribbella sp. NPDC051586]|uniref:Rv3235 family protein n=1 Tax=Kribbella sp. NPDC051586 TaxID=3364118 RepID=UPI00379F7BA3